MSKNKTSEAQLRASANYRDRNPDSTRYLRYRTTARTFVRHHATKDDIDGLIEIFKKENPNGKE